MTDQTRRTLLQQVREMQTAQERVLATSGRGMTYRAYEAHVDRLLNRLKEGR